MDVNKKINITLSWVAVILWMVLIFYLSAQVAKESNQLSTGITELIVKTVESVAPQTEFNIENFNHIVRKNAHFFAYLVLGILVINALREIWLVDFRGIVIALVICITYAVGDEVHQMFVPGRGPGIKDVFIDSAGAIVGIVVYLIVIRVYDWNKQKHMCC